MASNKEKLLLKLVFKSFESCTRTDVNTYPLINYLLVDKNTKYVFLVAISSFLGSVVSDLWTFLATFFVKKCKCGGESAATAHFYRKSCLNHEVALTSIVKKSPRPSPELS